MAATGVAALLPEHLSALPRFEWKGIALGADASLTLFGAEHAAQSAVAACLDEIERLESIFSLQRPESELCRLNAAGVLAPASHDLVRVLSLSRFIHAKTSGRFDPTVQPLWRLYADWFAGQPTRPDPPRALVERCLDLIGCDRIAIRGAEVRVPEGVQLTFNGIAQGYITDRVAELLRARGWSNVLADIGEVRALDGRPDGVPFTVAIRESGLELPLENAALSTSAGAALTFTSDGALDHILDPRSGSSAHYWRSLTVRHTSATVADGLSTGLSLSSPEEMSQFVSAVPGARVWAQDRNGRVHIHG
jgi:thiamine biosynthesis lipoprotein